MNLQDLLLWFAGAGLLTLGAVMYAANLGVLLMGITAPSKSGGSSMPLIGWLCFGVGWTIVPPAVSWWVLLGMLSLEVAASLLNYLCTRARR